MYRKNIELLSYFLIFEQSGPLIFVWSLNLHFTVNFRFVFFFNDFHSIWH